MNEQLEGFLKDLEGALKDIPQEERSKAMDYYREYLYDACESGLVPEEVIKQVGDAESIASAIKMEVSIDNARNNPGIRNYSNALKNTFRMVTTPFSVLMLIFLVLISGSIVAAFFATALCTFIAAIASLFIGIYEAARIPGHFLMERIGAFGMGLMSSGLMMLFTLWFYRLSKLFIRISVWFIGKIQRKPAQFKPDIKSDGNGRHKPAIKPVILFAAVSVLGLALFFASGLPMRYFDIFNSTKPNEISLQTYDSAVKDVNAISIVSAHSQVKILKGNGDGIQLIYEKPDWLDGEMKTEGKTLYFQEKSNGRLPLFSLVSIHESMTELQLLLPEGYDPAMIKVDSTGGHIFISGINCNIQAETMNGRIELILADMTSANITVKTERGTVYSDDRAAGQKTAQGTEYFSVGANGKSIELNSTNGNIYLRSQ